MSTFPQLKTGAIAQYPAGRSVSHSTDVFQFLDGSQQKYRQVGASTTTWTIQLDLLDDTELTGIAEFFQSQQGRFGGFEFVDPWDGSVHPNCSFATDDLVTQLTAEGRGTVKIVIQENKS